MKTDFPRGKTERLEVLQVLRAVAAIAVVLAHISAFATGGNARHHFPNFFIGNAGVDLFFIISGFTMVYTTVHTFGQAGASIDFAWKRIARVVPIYWVVTSWVICSHFTHDLSTTLGHLKSSVPHMLGSYFFIPLSHSDGDPSPIVQVGWTLNYEMFFYGAFSVVLLSRRRLAALLCLTLVFLSLTLSKTCFPMGEHPIFAIWTSPLILEFVFGMWLGVAYDLGVRIKPITSLALYVAAGLVFYFLFRNYGQDFTRLYGWGLGSFLIVASALLVQHPAKAVPSWFDSGWRILVLVGDASYVLYLIHLYLILTPKWMFRMDPSRFPWIFAACSLAISILTAIIIHFVLERPLTNAVRYLPRLAGTCMAAVRQWWAIGGDTVLPGAEGFSSRTGPSWPAKRPGPTFKAVSNE